jgi:hypothetical protein
MCGATSSRIEVAAELNQHHQQRCDIGLRQRFAQGGFILQCLVENVHFASPEMRVLVLVTAIVGPAAHHDNAFENKAGPLRVSTGLVLPETKMWTSSCR